jgi:hypothetical protein
VSRAVQCQARLHSVTHVYIAPRAVQCQARDTVHSEWGTQGAARVLTRVRYSIAIARETQYNAREMLADCTRNTI